MCNSVNLPNRGSNRWEVRTRQMITTEQAKRIIRELNIEFDSHDFIENYIAQFEREYVNMLVDKIESEQIFRTVNASIGRFLADNQCELGIVKNGREASQNVKGHETENQGWMKTL